MSDSTKQAGRIREALVALALHATDKTCRALVEIGLDACKNAEMELGPDCYKGSDKCSICSSHQARLDLLDLILRKAGLLDERTET